MSGSRKLPEASQVQRQGGRLGGASGAGAGDSSRCPQSSPSAFVSLLALRRNRTVCVHWIIVILWIELWNPLLPPVVVGQSLWVPDRDCPNSDKPLVIRRQGAETVVPELRKPARGMWRVGSGSVTRSRHRTVDVLKDIEANVAHAEPVVKVAGGAERHCKAGRASGQNWLIRLAVGQSSPCRALIAPPASGLPALSARHHSCVGQRKVPFDVSTPCRKIVDSMPPSLMLLPCLKHGGGRGSSRAGGQGN